MDDNNPPNDEGGEPLPNARRKRNCLLFLLGWGVVSGFVYGAATVDWEGPLYIIDLLVVLIGINHWVCLDAYDYDFELPSRFFLMMVICPGPLIVMPVYFVKTRSWKRGLAASAMGLLFLLLQAGLDLAASEVALSMVWGG